MAEFFRTSATWVVDFHYDGKARRWFKIFRPGVDVREAVEAELRALYEDRARLAGVRPATSEEELSYLRGEEPRNAYCPIDVSPKPGRS